MCLGGSAARGTDQAVCWHVRMEGGGHGAGQGLRILQHLRPVARTYIFPQAIWT